MDDTTKRLIELADAITNLSIMTMILVKRVGEMSEEQVEVEIEKQKAKRKDLLSQLK